MDCMPLAPRRLTYPLLARTRDFIKEDLDEELHVKRSLGKIRCMRGLFIYILRKEMRVVRRPLESKSYGWMKGVKIVYAQDETIRKSQRRLN
ncbi:MAG: hypothetical protein QW231_02250 [Candidatus Bathyarchaeia archaeon]